MQTGIIGFPQTGKTTLFELLTQSASSPGKRADQQGLALIPDPRLDALSEHYQPAKHTPARLELFDLATLTPADLRAGTGIAALRDVDALLHMVRLFRDPSLMHAASEAQPAQEIQNLEFDLIFSDLSQVEKRRERLEKELKKQRTPALQQEAELMARMQQHLEAEQPLRTLALNSDQARMVRGFQFLSQKPILYVLNLDESEAGAMDQAVERYGLHALLQAKPQSRALAVCAKIEREIASLPAPERTAFLAEYGLKEPGIVRIAHSLYELLGLISFFTAGQDECRAWPLPRGARALDAAAAIHSDLAHHFIRAEVIRWNELLEAGSEAAAREKGRLRLEGKEYIVQDGDVVHIRHSG